MAVNVEHERVLIVGSGPAGYTAAIYAARAELKPLVVAGLTFGGQLMLTTDVENYPGFPESVSGPDMMDLFQKQAERFGTRILFEDATRVELSARPFRVSTAEREFAAARSMAGRIRTPRIRRTSRSVRSISARQSFTRWASRLTPASTMHSAARCRSWKAASR